MMMKKNKKKKVISNPHSSKSLTNKEFVMFGGALVIYFWFMNTLDQIINYPVLMSFILGCVIFIFLFTNKIRDFLLELNEAKNILDKIILSVIRILSTTIFSWFITGILLIPFNYYDIYSSESKVSHSLNLQILGLYARPRNNVIYYDFNGKTKMLNGKIGIMDEIYEKGNYKDYQLVLVVRDGLLGSYILKDWDIKKKE